MKKKKFIIPLFLVLAVICAVFVFRAHSEEIGLFFFGDKPTRIENGFTAELTDMLAQKYELHIPAQAVFLDGVFTNSFRDPAVVISFEIDFSNTVPQLQNKPQDEKEELLVKEFHRVLFSGDSWDSVPGPMEPGWGPEINDLLGTTYARQLDYRGESFTFLFYTVTEDGLVRFCFYGHHPGDPIT